MPTRTDALPRRLKASVVSASWARRELRMLRAGTARKHGVEAEIGVSPPTGSLRGHRGVALALRAGRASCMERSLIFQRFLADRGHEHDVVIGVARADSGEFQAHAWIEGVDDHTGACFTEIRRRSP